MSSTFFKPAKSRGSFLVIWSLNSRNIDHVADMYLNDAWPLQDVTSSLKRYHDVCITDTLLDAMQKITKIQLELSGELNTDTHSRKVYCLESTLDSESLKTHVENGKEFRHTLKEPLTPSTEKMPETPARIH